LVGTTAIAKADKREFLMAEQKAVEMAINLAVQLANKLAA
jgi:hypothetical protein